MRRKKLGLDPKPRIWAFENPNFLGSARPSNPSSCQGLESRYGFGLARIDLHEHPYVLVYNYSSKKYGIPINFHIYTMKLAGVRVMETRVEPSTMLQGRLGVLRLGRQQLWIACMSRIKAPWVHMARSQRANHMEIT